MALWKEAFFCLQFQGKKFPQTYMFVLDY